jgi:hypothetical protein
LTPVHDDALPVEWEECEEINFDPNELQREAPEGGAYAALPVAASKAKNYAAWQKELVTWIYSHQCMDVYSSPALKMMSHAGESEGEFRVRVQQGLREQRDAAVEKLRAKYAPKIATLQDRLMRARQAVERERQEAQSNTLNAALDIGASVFGAMFGRKQMTTAARSAMRGASRYSKQSGDVGRAEETMEAVAAQLDALEQQFHDEASAMQAVSDPAIERVGIKPKKANIQVRLLTLAWAPYGQDGNAAW